MNQPNLPARSTPALPAMSAPPERAAAAGQSAPITQTEPSLTLLEVMLRHKGKLVACVVAAMVLGVLYQLSAPRIYESRAEIFVEQTREGQPNSPLAPGGLSAGQPSTHASLLGSTPVLVAALQDPEVAASKTLAKYGTEGARLRFLKKKLSINFSRELETVSVAFRGKTQDETALIVNAVVAAYQRELNIEAPVREGVADSQDPVRRGVMSERMLEARLMKLTEELTAAQVAVEGAEARRQEAVAADGDLAKLAVLLDEAGMNSSAQGLAEIAYLKAELARLDQQLEGMPDGWGPSHAVRGPVQRQADALRYEISALRTNAAVAMTGLLVASHDSAAARVAELEQRIGADQAVAAGVAQLPIRVIEYGTRPEKKVAPRGIKTLGISIFLGLAFGIAWVLLTELKSDPAEAYAAEQRAREELAAAETSLVLLRSGDVAQTLEDSSPPLLGHIPEVPTGRRLTSPNFDATASSIHQIRAVLQVQSRTKNARAFAFTSPRRGAGKTSVTIGVASSLAMSGTKTLVVDCDLAGRIARGQTGRPAENKNGTASNGQATDDGFGPLDPEGSSPDNASLDNIVLAEGYVSEDDEQAIASPAQGIKVGVTGMLDGGRLDECAVDATVPGLSLLPAVNAQTHHIGMMSDAFVRRLIDEAQGTYDLVLFDTGPVPGSVEALLVTSQVDGVVVVVPQGEARAALTRTMSYLKVVGATVFGTVFNRASDAPRPGKINPRGSSLAGAAATASAAAASHTAVNNAGQDPLIELETHQSMTDDDGEFLEGDAPLGSGILAAAVFSDADSAFASNDWKLEETSEFTGSVDELFGKIDGALDDDLEL